MSQEKISTEFKKPYVPQFSEELDKMIESMSGGAGGMSGLIAGIVSVQMLLRKEGQFLTKHAFREALDEWEDSVKVLAESFKTTAGRNYSWISASTSLAGVFAGGKEVGEALAKAIDAHGNHGSTLESGLRQLLSHASDKTKSLAENMKYTSQNEQQQVDELRGIVSRIYQATHDLMTVMARG